MKHIDKMKHADRIRLIMKNRDIKQIPMSRAAGVSQSTINRILNGESTPNHKTLVKISKGLDVPVEALTHPCDSTAEIIYELSRMDKEHIRTVLEYVKAIRSYRAKSETNPK